MQFATRSIIVATFFASLSVATGTVTETARPAADVPIDLTTQYSGGKSGASDGKRDSPKDAPKKSDKKPDKSDKADKSDPSVDPSWLDRLGKEDRAAIEPLIGLAPPPFTKELVWVDMPVTTWKDLQGKVVVVQSWTNRNSSGRALVAKLKEGLKEFKPEDVVIIALQTPDGAEKAEEFLKKSPVDVGVAVDPTGAFSDSVGAFKRPVNFVVDRGGTVRFAGLNPTGLPKAVAALVKEPADAIAAPKQPMSETPTVAEVRWPTFDNPLSRARDLRGKAGPPFFVADWVTDRADPQGKLLLVDFFATWCGPCMAAVPHMNELASKFGRDVCVVAISDESKSQVETGLLKRNMKANSFRYAIGSDTRAQMKGAFGVTAIPHCVVMSTDGVVRWQGHPNELSESVMQSLVSAQQAARGAAGGGDAPRNDVVRNRWAAEKKRS